jgi:hypothetical protein
VYCSCMSCAHYVNLFFHDEGLLILLVNMQYQLTKLFIIKDTYIYELRR